GGGWVFGPAVAWFYAATGWIDRGFPRPPAEPQASPSAATPGPRVPRAAMWALLGLLLWAASAIVPRPLETLARPFRFLADVSVDPLTGSIEELRRWSWSADHFGPFTALLGLWLLALLAGGQRMFGVSPALTLLGLGSFALGFLGVRFRGLAAWMGFAPLAIALAPRGPVLARWALATPVIAAAGFGAYQLCTAPQYQWGAHPHLYSVPVRAA